MGKVLFLLHPSPSLIIAKAFPRKRCCPSHFPVPSNIARPGTGESVFACHQHLNAGSTAWIHHLILSDWPLRDIKEQTRNSSFRLQSCGFTPWTRPSPAASFMGQTSLCVARPLPSHEKCDLLISQPVSCLKGSVTGMHTYWAGCAKRLMKWE